MQHRRLRPAVSSQTDTGFLSLVCNHSHQPLVVTVPLFLFCFLLYTCTLLIGLLLHSFGDLACPLTERVLCKSLTFGLSLKPLVFTESTRQISRLLTAAAPVEISLNKSYRIDMHVWIQALILVHKEN